jgi:TolB protein
MNKKIMILLTSLITVGTVYALQDIQIVGGTNAGNPKVAVVNFTGDSTADETNVSRTVANDLSITGEFTVKQYPDATNIEPGTKYIITGGVNGNTINFKLNGSEIAGKSSQLLDQNVTYTTNVRKAAHTISNNTYQKITNVKGIFTTKIAYIRRSGNTYSIIVSDYDGYNQKSIFSSGHPVSSLAWDSSGNLLAYVSFESGKPVVYVQNLSKAQRYVVANFTGSNSSPAFTPDGRRLAVTLSKDDRGSHIYLVNNSSNATATDILPSSFNGSIQTEASFSNNGNMVFSSNHDGGAQIFMSNIQGAAPSRLTVNLGNYNVTPRFSHDASKITFVNRSEGILKAYLMDLATKVSYPISLQTTQDLAPSFAPNDKLILFSSNGESIYIGNSTGTIQTRLNKVSGNGTIIDQSWANNF